LKYLEKTRSKEMSLLNENEIIWLQLALKKIPEPDKKPKRMYVDFRTRQFTVKTKNCLKKIVITYVKIYYS
jgi:hypothetical protein